MTELTVRLRHMARLVGFDLTLLLNEAADEIDRLLAQPQYLSGCQLRGPGECQSRGACQSDACNNSGKVIVKRVCVEPKEAGILYPKVEMVPTSGLNDVNETTANYARREELNGK